jgi:CRISPR system Cascade subunit CasD
LLAAAQGRRRSEPIEDLLRLELGVRTDHAGTVLRDYHTVSDYRGEPLLSASVNARGVQKKTSPKKYTAVTERFYLQDAVFIAAVASTDRGVLDGLRDALRRPAFPLALGRRCCVPTLPIVLDFPDRRLWQGTPAEVLAHVPWYPANVRYGSETVRTRIRLPITVDDPAGQDMRSDVPVSFDPHRRGFATRRVRHGWVDAPAAAQPAAIPHDPFELLE